MPVKAFIDTNLLIYLYSQDQPEKRGQVLKLVETHDCTISVQVLNEFVNVLKRKFFQSTQRIEAAILEIESCFPIQGLSASLVKHALVISDRFGYSHYDSLIITAALESECTILFTEDMQHNQSINGRLIIHNPFM